MTPLLLPLFFSLLAPAQAQVPLDAQPVSGAISTKERLGGAFGLGICLGAPTGLSGKLWLGQGAAFQFAAGGDMGHFKGLAGSADFVFQFRPVNVEGDEFSLPLHFGGGLKTTMSLQDGFSILLLGPRVVAGASVLVPSLPVDLYFEVAPAVYVYEAVGWVMEGQIGARYYF